jgi:hypothetical protein
VAISTISQIRGIYSQSQMTQLEDFIDLRSKEAYTEKNTCVKTFLESHPQSKPISACDKAASCMEAALLFLQPIAQDLRQA